MQKRIKDPKDYLEEMKEAREKTKLTLRKQKLDQLIMTKRLMTEDNTKQEKIKVKYEIKDEALLLKSSIRNLTYETQDILVKEMTRLLLSSDINEIKYGILVIRKYCTVDKYSLIRLFQEKIDELLFTILLNGINDPSIIFETIWIMINYSYHSSDNTAKLLLSPISVNAWEKVIRKQDYVLTSHLLWLFCNCIEDNLELNILFSQSDLFIKTILPLLESEVTFKSVLVKGVKLLSLIIKNDNNPILQYRLISVIITNYINNGTEVKNECLKCLALASFIPQELVQNIIPEIIKQDNLAITNRIINILLMSNDINEINFIETIINYLADGITNSNYAHQHMKESLMVLSNYLEKNNNKHVIRMVIIKGLLGKLIEIAINNSINLAKEALLCIYYSLNCQETEILLMIFQYDLCGLVIALMNRKESDNEFIELILDVMTTIIEISKEITQRNNTENYIIKTFEAQGGAELLSHYLLNQSQIIYQKASMLLSIFSSSFSNMN